MYIFIIIFLVFFLLTNHLFESIFGSLWTKLYHFGRPSEARPKFFENCGQKSLEIWTTWGKKIYYRGVGVHPPIKTCCRPGHAMRLSIRSRQEIKQDFKNASFFLSKVRIKDSPGKLGSGFMISLSIFSSGPPVFFFILLWPCFFGSAFFRCAFFGMAPLVLPSEYV